MYEEKIVYLSGPSDNGNTHNTHNSASLQKDDNSKNDNNDNNNRDRFYPIRQSSKSSYFDKHNNNNNNNHNNNNNNNNNIDYDYDRKHYRKQDSDNDRIKRDDYKQTEIYEKRNMNRLRSMPDQDDYRRIEPSSGLAPVEQYETGPIVETIMYPFVYTIPTAQPVLPPIRSKTPQPQPKINYRPLTPPENYSIQNYPTKNYSNIDYNYTKRPPSFYYDNAYNKLPLTYKQQSKESKETISSYYCLSIIACILCPICGIAALCFSRESRDHYKAREYNTAFTSGLRAKSFSYCAICTNITFILILGIVAGATVGILKGLGKI